MWIRFFISQRNDLNIHFNNSQENENHLNGFVDSIFNQSLNINERIEDPMVLAMV
jgi:hypothetical protein